MNKLFVEFLKTEKASGLFLIICTLVSISLANSGIGASYLSFWHTSLLGTPLISWINDGIMTFFFLLIGLEIERQIYVGELSQPKQALLPILAAVGGMIAPALFHLTLNFGTPTQSGFAIPVATDIAFALGVLSLLGNRVPLSLKVFLTALAIIDDLGSIVVIGLFYSHGFSAVYFLLAVATALILFGLNRMNVHSLVVYLVGGLILWYFIHCSGIHATIAGVILAFLIPFGKGENSSPSSRLQHGLHYPVAYIILPLFALGNTGLHLSGDAVASLFSLNSLGIILGLVVGKPIGIVTVSAIAVRLGMCALPSDITWKGLAATSFLCGIGFTMSIFITLLAFGQQELVEQSKIAILLASTVAGTAGYASLHCSLDRDRN
jgi:Na+:H+ antiporter, NhaA family